jgi:hypothetical protein
MNKAVVNESQSVVVEVEEGSQVTEEEEGGMDELGAHLMLCTDVRVVRTGSEFLCVFEIEVLIINYLMQILILLSHITKYLFQ